MKLIVALLIIYISATSSYQIHPIKGINGTSETINFDSKGNGYVVVNNNEHRHFYKINHRKQILWKISISSEVSRIIINSHDDVYVIFWPDEKEIIITIFNENNFQFQNIDSIRAFNFDLATDGGGNIFYNRDDGVQLLTRHATTPKPIKNLEDYNFSGEKKN